MRTSASCIRWVWAKTCTCAEMADETALSALAERLQRVRERIRCAAAACGRNPEDIQLLAVSKFHPGMAVGAAAAAGQFAFGESYVQEARRKQETCAHISGLEWHLIGHLQRNKARDAVGRFVLIHSLGTAALADALQAALEKAALADTDNEGAAVRQAVLIQVNIGEEQQKTGIALKDLPELAEKVITCGRLRLLGLMAIPPFFDDPERARPCFARLREARDRLADRLGLTLPHLSMGMSGDLEAAVGEGATIVRVGTDIFGPRLSP